MIIVEDTNVARVTMTMDVVTVFVAGGEGMRAGDASFIVTLGDGVEEWLNANCVGEWKAHVGELTVRNSEGELIGKLGSLISSTGRLPILEFNDERDEILFKTFWL